MAEKEEPDLSLMEADIRNVATIVELTAALRQLDARLLAITGMSELTSQAVGRMETMVREIALGLGVKVP